MIIIVTTIIKNSYHIKHSRVIEPAKNLSKPNLLSDKELIINNRYRSVLISGFMCCAIVLSALIVSCSETSDNSDGQSAVVVNYDISVQKAYELISDNPETIILDVRTPEEFDGGHIESSINIDFYSPDYADELKKLDKDSTYLVYCRTGNRSSYFVQTMKVLGFTDMYNMTGGITDWISLGYPVVE